MSPDVPWNLSARSRVVFLEMHRRFAFLSGLALCGVLAGCASSPGVASLHAARTALKPITIHAGTQASPTNAIEAVVSIGQSGTYLYDLAFGRVPPAPGEQPQVCHPLAGFRLISEQGGVKYINPSVTSPGEVTGSIVLSAGQWTGSSGNGSSATGLAISPPPPPVGTFWSWGCPWTLTLTPSN